MKLFTCGAKTAMGNLGHPCGRAANALDEAGIEYELEAVGGFRNIPFSSLEGKRDEVERLSGQQGVPILVLEDGEVITGSGTIVTWAKARRA